MHVETESEKEVATQELDLTKFPYLEMTKKSIETMDRLIELMNQKRVILKGRMDAGNVSNEVAIDAEIELIKLDANKAKLHTQLIQKKQKFNDSLKTAATTMLEMETEYDKVIAAMERGAGVDKAKHEYLKSIDVSEFENNYEKKLSHYWTCKGSVAPKDKGLKKVK